MNPGERNRKGSGSAAIGSVMIVVGALFLIDRLTSFHFGEVMRTWWPLIPLAIGVARLGSRDGVWNSLWLIAVGLWLLAVQLELFGATYRNSWPLLLIVLGGGMVARALFDVSSGRERNHGA